MAIDKNQLYGQFSRSSDRAQALNGQIIRKSLDLPEDMNTTIRNGLGWKEIVVLGGIALGAVYLINQPTPPPAPGPAPTVVPAEDRDTTRRIEIEKYIPPATVGREGTP